MGAIQGGHPGGPKIAEHRHGGKRAGTRVPVASLIAHLQAGERLEDFLEGFPTVSRAQAEAFLDLALQAILSIEVATVAEQDWKGKRNSELLELASREFDAFITGDQNEAPGTYNHGASGRS